MMFKSVVEIRLLDSKMVEWKILPYIKSFKFTRSIMAPTATLEFELAKSNMGLMPRSDADIDFDVLEIEKEMVVGSMLRLCIDNSLIFTGYIVALNPKAGIAEDTISVRCKDIIWRLQNTTLYHYRPACGTQGIMPLINHAINGLKKPEATGLPSANFDANDIYKNIKIFESQQLHILKITGIPPNADLQSDTELIKEADAKPKENESAYDFIKRLLRPWGYLCQATAEGTLQIFRPNTKDDSRYTFKHDSGSRKIYGSKTAPILGTPSLNIDIENFHSEYFVYGSSVGDDKKRIAIRAYYENPEFPKDKQGKPLCRCPLFICEHNLQSQAACVKKAKRTCGFEIAKMWNYEFAIAGFGLESSLFSNDIVVSIEDEFNGVSSPVYITEITMTGSPTQQNTQFKATLTTALLLD